MYARPRFEDGETSTFGVSGKLWRDALVMYDRKSRSLWSQVDGRAWAGPSSGQSLQKIPSQVTTWASWKQQHPETLVLVKPVIDKSPYQSYYERASWVGLPWTRVSKDDRLPAKTLVLGIELDGSASLAVDLEHLEQTQWLSGEVDDLPVLVVAPRDPRAALAYVRRVEGQVLDLEPDRDQGTESTHFVDRQTGSRWFWETGEAVSGPLAGKRLPALPTTPIYWVTWTAFHPESALWPERAE